MASFYIASKLENEKEVRKLAAILKSWGHRHTYDWTAHGAVYRDDAKPEENAQACAEVAEKEMNGVRTADVVIVLTPGGRGTHAELGMALALGKRVIMAGLERHLAGSDGRPCAFYHHPLVKHVPLNHGLILTAMIS